MEANKERALSRTTQPLTNIIPVLTLTSTSASSLLGLLFYPGGGSNTSLRNIYLQTARLITQKAVHILCLIV
jgi:hypothetical protein